MKLTDSLSVIEVAPVGVGDVAVEGVLAPVVDRIVEQRGAVVYVLGVPSHQAIPEPFLWKKICRHHQCSIGDVDKLAMLLNHYAMLFIPPCRMYIHW